MQFNMLDWLLRLKRKIFWTTPSQIDLQFDRAAQRLDHTALQLNELHQQSDRLAVGLHNHFDQLNERIDRLHREMHDRFDNSNQHESDFENLLKHLNELRTQSDQRGSDFENLLKHIHGLRTQSDQRGSDFESQLRDLASGFFGHINHLFYMQDLTFQYDQTSLLGQRLGGRAKFLNEDNHEEYNIYNASIIRFSDQIIAFARRSNMTVLDNSVHFYKDGKTHNSKIVIFRFSNELNVLSAVEINDERIRQKIPEIAFGFEDARLFEWRDQLFAIAAGVGPDSITGLRVTQCLITIENFEIKECVLLPSPRGSKFEKNWIPHIKNNRLMLLYKLANPQIILEYNESSKSASIERGSVAGLTDEFQIRGSTTFIKIDTKFIGLVHMPPIKLGGKIYYLHKWAVLDSELKLIETSEPFFLIQRGIEFAAGLIEHEGNFVISCGIGDRRSALLSVPKQAVLENLLTFV